MEENSVFGSDEEVDDPPEVDSDEDFSDEGDKQDLEEVWLWTCVRLSKRWKMYIIMTLVLERICKFRNYT